jgi:hypothetical protein
MGRLDQSGEYIYMTTGISIIGKTACAIMIGMIAFMLLNGVMVSSLSTKCLGSKYTERSTLKDYGGIWGPGLPWLVFEIKKDSFHQFYSRRLWVPAQSDEIVMLNKDLVGGAMGHRFKHWEKCLLNNGDILYMSKDYQHVETSDVINLCFVVFST